MMAENSGDNLGEIFVGIRANLSTLNKDLTEGEKQATASGKRIAQSLSSSFANVRLGVAEMLTRELSNLSRTVIPIAARIGSGFAKSFSESYARTGPSAIAGVAGAAMYKQSSQVAAEVSRAVAASVKATVAAAPAAVSQAAIQARWPAAQRRDPATGRIISNSEMARRTAEGGLASFGTRPPEPPVTSTGRPPMGARPRIGGRAMSNAEYDAYVAGQRAAAAERESRRLSSGRFGTREEKADETAAENAHRRRQRELSRAFALRGIFSGMSGRESGILGELYAQQLQAGLSWAGGLPGRAAGWAGGKIGAGFGWMGDRMVGASSWAGGKLGAAAGSVMSAIGPTVNYYGTRAANMGAGIVQEAKNLASLVGPSFAVVSNLGKSAFNRIGTTASTVFAGISSAVTSTAEILGPALATACEVGSTAISALYATASFGASTIFSAFGKILGTIGSIGKKVYDGIIWMLTAPFKAASGIIATLMKGLFLPLEMIMAGGDVRLATLFAFKDLAQHAIRTHDEFLKATREIRGATAASRELSDTIGEMSMTSGRSREELTASMRAMADAGLDAKESMMALPVAIQYAGVAGKTAGESVDFLTYALAKMDYQITSAADRAKHLEYIGNVITKAANRGGMTVSTLQQSLMPMLEQAGRTRQDLGDIAAVLAAASKTGEKNFGAKLAAIYNRLGAQVAGGESPEFAQVREAVQTQSGETKPIFEMIKSLDDLLKQQGEGKKAFLKKVFGHGEMMRSVEDLLDIADSAKAVRDSMKDVRGAMDEMPNDTWATGFSRIRQIWDNFLGKLSEPLGKLMGRIAKSFADFGQRASNALQPVFDAIAKGFERVSPLIVTAIDRGLWSIENFAKSAGLTKGVSAVVDAIFGGFKAAGELAYLMASDWNKAWEIIRDGAKLTGDWMIVQFDRAFKFLGEQWQRFKGWSSSGEGKSFFDNLSKWAKDWVGWFGDLLKEMFRSVAAFIGPIFTDVINQVVQELPDSFPGVALKKQQAALAAGRAERADQAFAAEMHRTGGRIPTVDEAREAFVNDEIIRMRMARMGTKSRELTEKAIAMGLYADDKMRIGRGGYADDRDFEVAMNAWKAAQRRVGVQIPAAPSMPEFGGSAGNGGKISKEELEKIGYLYQGNILDVPEELRGRVLAARADALQNKAGAAFTEQQLNRYGTEQEQTMFEALEAANKKGEQLQNPTLKPTREGTPGLSTPDIRFSGLAEYLKQIQIGAARDPMVAIAQQQLEEAQKQTQELVAIKSALNGSDESAPALFVSMKD